MGRLAVCVLVLQAWLTGQQPSFRVQAKVVQVPVTVTERHGRSVSGLKADDFKVLDDGQEQPITVDDLGTGLPRISLAILVQTSGISMPALKKIRRIGSMVVPLVIGSHGEAAVVTFDNKITWLQDFTSDDDKIAAAVNNLKASPVSDQARMLDAIVDAAAHMEPVQGRKMLLLISESRDRGSETKFQEALKAVEAQGIEVFGAHYSAFATSLGAKPKDLPQQPSSPPEDPTDGPPSAPGIDFTAMVWEIGRLGKTNAVQALTRATGGIDYPFLKERGIESSIGKLGAEVQNQYILSFPQRQDTPGMHQIMVSLPDLPGLEIRARRGYWVETNGSFWLRK
ncbi:MAG TPA: VWA domain-containing protein [Verrucomicrobiae bacterium]|nr:VWA domain-containing protein [Verrucomicrobiae bacterium]